MDYCFNKAEEKHRMIYAPPVMMKDKDFKRFSSLIYEQVGIRMPQAKKNMLEARLQKRLRHLGIRTFSEYGDFIFSPEGRDAELVHMIDVVTTNKTDFFREPGHFEFLTQTALPTIMKSRENMIAHPVRLWSAGCSSGEEPYTLAMVLTEFSSECRNFHYSILASDISTRILQTARKAVYPEESANSINLNYKRKYFLRSKDRSQRQVRISPQLRSQVVFRRINFMDEDFGIKEKMDIIFCRNVIIYFDKLTQQNLINKFYRQLRPGGFLFLGHSETLNGMDVDFTTVGSTVYQKV
jgi:chemotaxis protein methyltransferase CheR